MAWRGSAPISTREPSRRWLSSRPCSTPGRLAGSSDDTARIDSRSPQPIHISADNVACRHPPLRPGSRGIRSTGIPVDSPSSNVCWSCRTKKCNEAIDDVFDRFRSRHHGLTDTFLQHADELSDRLDPARRLSPTRRLLLGATFTSEYAIEGAALCNPSMVMHPDQAGVEAGDIRFVMSVRAIGEGHTSSIGFRTGTVTGSGRRRIRRSSDLCHQRTAGRADAGGRSLQRRAPSTPRKRG